MSDPRYCPQCSEVWVSGRQKCSCGFKLKAARNDIGGPPRFCTWSGCDTEVMGKSNSGVVFAEVMINGNIYRRHGSEVFDGKGMLRSGYVFHAWVVRCPKHFFKERDAVKLDWREQMLRDFQSAHPEFAVVPSDESERRDVIAMAKSFANRPAPWQSNPDRRAELQRRMDEMRQQPSAADTMPDSFGGTDILATA